MKLNRDGSRLFVAVSGLPKCPPTVPDEECAKLERDLNADGIAIVDTATHKVVRVLPAGSDPEQFALSADGSRLFVANEDAATMSVVDVASGSVVARIPVGREPEGVGIAPDGRWVLVTNESDNSVSVIDTRHAEGREIRAGRQASARRRIHAGRSRRLRLRRIRCIAVSHGRAARRAGRARAATAQGSAADGGGARLQPRSPVREHRPRRYCRGHRQRKPQAPRRSAGRDAAVGHRVVAGRALALHRERSVERREHRRYRDAACRSANSASDARRGAWWSGPSRRKST